MDNETTTDAGTSPDERSVRPLVERLREMSRRGHWPLLGDEAADEIERLQALADSEGSRAVEYLRRARKAEAEATKSERRAITFGDIVHTQILAMRAAVVAWQRADAEKGMQWIANTLAGPGHLPSDEDIALGAQPLFDKEMAAHEAFRAAHPAP